VGGSRRSTGTGTGSKLKKKNTKSRSRRHPMDELSSPFASPVSVCLFVS
jgi:hypothetical protein